MATKKKKTIVITPKRVFAPLLGLVSAIAIIALHGSVLPAIMVGIFTGALLWSKKIGSDMAGFSLVVAFAYLAFNNGSYGWSLFAGIIALALYYSFIILLVKLAEKNTFFTTIRLNEYKVIETGDGMLDRFIGMGMRWETPEGKLDSPEKKDPESKLVPYVPHPKTGKVVRADQHSLAIRLQYHLMGRLGITWIGLAGIARIKKFEMCFETIVAGKIVKREYVGKDAVDTIFDSFTYVFQARELESQGNVNVFIIAQTRMYVDNLYEVAYGALPAGRWVDNAGGKFRNFAKEHAAQRDFKQLLEEKHPDKLAATRADLNDSFQSEMTSDSARSEFIAASGHFVQYVDIYDFGLEGSDAIKKAYAQKELNKVEQAASLEFETVQIDIEDAKYKQALIIRKREAEEGMAAVDVEKAYIKDVIMPIKDNPAALNTLSMYHISRSNVTAIGTGITSIIPQGEGGGNRRNRDRNDRNRDRNNRNENKNDKNQKQGPDGNSKKDDKKK